MAKPQAVRGDLELGGVRAANRDSDLYFAANAFTGFLSRRISRERVGTAEKQCGWLVEVGKTPETFRGCLKFTPPPMRQTFGITCRSRCLDFLLPPPRSTRKSLPG